MHRNPVVFQPVGTTTLLQQHFWNQATSEGVTTSPATQYEIVSVRSEHFNDVMDFLRHNFFVDEPLNICLQLVANSEPGTCPELEEFALSSLQQGVSLMAVVPGGSIIGVCINAVSHPGDVEELKKLATECPNQKFKIILGLLAHVEEKSNVHERFNVQSVFDVPILSVDSSCRGQGVATALLKGSIQQARKRGYPIFRVDCSSEFTARAVAKLGLHKVFSMRYDEYRPSSIEEPPLQPEPPHHEIKAYVMELNA